jgi:hypothetical protein
MDLDYIHSLKDMKAVTEVRMLSAVKSRAMGPVY